ncbi:hypothetical protein H5410_049397 [Solanum commersonii]|uniref:Uncharacterized protein n=1 Tax=Solanum commersonii TaxID=4109 RepID=A0A9J5WST8_SOLCO|nr:hypothetical protein H5410_049397 [Solanum commersonii]
MVARTEKTDMEAAPVGMEATRPPAGRDVPLPQLRATVLYCCDGGVAWRGVELVGDGGVAPVGEGGDRRRWGWVGVGWG